MADRNTADPRADDDGGEPEEDRAPLEAARDGRLREYLSTREGNDAVYLIISRVVFQRITRPLELRRGHGLCAGGAGRLEAACHDRHQDDVEALYLDLLGDADKRIANLPAWLSSRAEPASIDEYRRRRSERGALQRPRMTVWLAQALGEDPWLQRLALNILDWVGVDATAGYDVWPLRAWVEQRAAMVEGPALSEAEMDAEVQHVLDTMRTKRSNWYAAHVEHPLGHKQAPLAPFRRTDTEGFREAEHVRHTTPDDQVEALLRELASTALDLVEALIAQGRPLREAVASALTEAFGTAETEPDERAGQLIAEPEVFNRIVSTVEKILSVVRQDPWEPGDRGRTT